MTSETRGFMASLPATRFTPEQYLEEHPEMMDEIEGIIRGDEKAAEILTVGATEE